MSARSLVAGGDGEKEVEEGVGFVWSHSDWRGILCALSSSPKLGRAQKEVNTFFISRSWSCCFAFVPHPPCQLLRIVFLLLPMFHQALCLNEEQILPSRKWQDLTRLQNADFILQQAHVQVQRIANNLQSKKLICTRRSHKFFKVLMNACSTCTAS